MAAKTERSTLGVRLPVRELENTEALQRAAIGCQALLGDQSARVLEFTSTQVSDCLRHLCDEIVLAFPASAVMHTSAGQGQWAGALTGILRDDPGFAAMEVRRRRA